MTYSTLASIVKYPFPSRCAGEHGKFGFFECEMETYQKIAKELGIGYTVTNTEDKIYQRYPLVYLVEAADDICYEIMDIEDSFKLKILALEETKGLLLHFFPIHVQEKIKQRFSEVTDPNEQIAYLRSCAINCLEKACVATFTENEDKILNGDFEGSLMEHIDPLIKEAYYACAATAKQKIYCSKDVVDIEIAGYKIITTLIDAMIYAVLHPEKAYSKILLNRISDQYETNAPSVYGRIIAVLDCISGMTDIYALNLYQKINGMSLPIL